MEFITQLLNGLSLGSIYALVALGYSMVYGIVQLINFAHGDIIMVGGYMMYLAMTAMRLPMWLAVMVPDCRVCTGWGADRADRLPPSADP